jgi:type I restriction enzyme S subunit
MNKEEKILPALRFPEFENDGKWELTTIGKNGKFYYGKSAPKWSLSEDAPTLCVRYGELYTKFGTIINEVVSRTNIDPKTLKFSKGGEILVPRVGEDPYAFSKCSYLPFPNIAIGEMISVYETKQDPIFYTYYFNTLSKQFARVVEGQNVKNLYYVNLEPIKIGKPHSIKEQQKIANCLTSLDNLITAETEKLAHLKDHKKSLLQQLFPIKGETKPQFRFPEFKNDGDWERKLLGAISEITTGTSNRQDSTKEEGKYTFFDRSQDIRTSNRFLFDGEAIIVAGEGQEFKPKYFIGKFDLHQRAYAILDFDDKTIGKFLYYSIYKNRSYFLRYAVGSTVKSLRLPIFQNMPTLIPSNPKEQQTIANCLSSADDLIEAQKTKIKSLKEHKKGLMQQLFPNTTNQ